MKRLLGKLTVEVIRSAVREWVNLLATEQYDVAASYCSGLPSQTNIITAKTIKDCIGRYSKNYRNADALNQDQFIPKITSTNIMNIEGENLQIYGGLNEDRISVDYDLPIDQKWSDLTVSMDFFKIDGEYRITLVDIRVL